LMCVADEITRGIYQESYDAFRILRTPC